MKNNNDHFIASVLSNKVEMMEWGNIYYIYIQTKKSNEIKTNSQRQLIYIQPKETQIHRDNTHPSKQKHNFTETAHIQPK